jgi:DNA repair protein RadC
MEGEQKTTYTIKDMRREDKPRERLVALGAQALTKTELLAIMLR